MNELESFITATTFNYHHGIELMKKYASSHPLFGLICASNNSFSREKMIEILSSVKINIDENTRKKKRYSPEEVAKWHPDVIALYNNIKLKYASMNSAQAVLRNTIYGSNGLAKKRYSVKKCAEISHEIMHLDQSIRDSWAILDNYVKTGFIPDSIKKKDELSQLRYWLSVQCKYKSWVEHNHHLKDTNEYREKHQVISDIKRYLDENRQNIL